MNAMNVLNWKRKEPIRSLTKKVIIKCDNLHSLYGST